MGIPFVFSSCRLLEVFFLTIALLLLRSQREKAEEMMKSDQGKSATRKPLGDISNAGNHLRSGNKGGSKNGDDGALERLLLLRSDLSKLIEQIYKLVAQAVENKTISKRASHDIDSFSKLLSDMHLSLKPWFSKLQLLDAASVAPEKMSNQASTANSISGVMKDGDAIANNKNEPELELIVSPSPLVSWRVGTCTVGSERQLFLLTPLPNSKVCRSRCLQSSKPMVGIFTEAEKSCCYQLPASSITACSTLDDLHGKTEEKKVPSDVSKPFSVEQMSGTLELSPLLFSNHKNKKINIRLSTPSIPKSSTMLDPIFQPCQKNYEEASKPAEGNNEAEFSNDSNGEISDSLSTKYQELLGLHPAPVLKSRRKEIDETLNWFLSPPKTCTLLEPSDEFLLPTPKNMLATPAWKNLESTQKSNLPGEATLKRELWAKFEAVSSNQLHFDASIFQRTGSKGFLDMLDEVSETSDSDFKVD